MGNVDWFRKLFEHGWAHVVAWVTSRARLARGFVAIVDLLKTLA